MSDDGDTARPIKYTFTTRTAVGFALSGACVALLWIWSAIAALLAVEVNLTTAVASFSFTAAGTSMVCWMITFQACRRGRSAAAERAAVLAGTLTAIDGVAVGLDELRALHVEMVRGVAGMVRVTALDDLDEGLALRDGLVLAALREVAARLPPPVIDGDRALPDGMAAQIYEMGRRTGAKGHGNGNGRN